MDYKEKVKKYDSENLLARSLHENCYANNPSFIRFMSEEEIDFKAYGEFNKAEFIERINLYKELCKRVWDVNNLDRA
ncbi:MAG: hypothetical protein ACRCXT_01260 [Paraclostridium sp.]